jgi:hypothetical protein
MAGSRQAPAPDDAGDDAARVESTAAPPPMPAPRGSQVAPHRTRRLEPSGTEVIIRLEARTIHQEGAASGALPTSPIPRPELPRAIARSLYLGPPCHKGHTYNGTTYGLRKKSNRGCVQCEQERQRRATAQARRAHKAHRTRARRLDARQARQHQRAAITATLTTPDAAATNGHRPELPASLAQSCFLSPIGCDNPRHRYRDTAYTLRYLETEMCVQCVTGGGE